MVKEYEFKALEDKFFESRTEEALEALAQWYELYGQRYWNGYEWTGHRGGKEYFIKPIEEVSEYDINPHNGQREPVQWETTGYTFEWGV